MRSVWIGYDSRETEAFAVCRRSIREHTRQHVPIHGVSLEDVRECGLYRRPTTRRDGKLWDEISDAPMATEFAISRFLTPFLAKRGWALFMDCDILCRSSLTELFALADDRYAVMCVKHPNYVTPEQTKMDGQVQSFYARKNWSSVMLFNVDHPANNNLTVEMINRLPGRDLHRLCWLDDREIGELPPEFNYLVGVSHASIEPKLVHFTSGGPWFPGYEDVEYASEWRAARQRWLDGLEPRIPVADHQAERVHAHL